MPRQLYFQRQLAVDVGERRVEAGEASQGDDFPQAVDQDDAHRTPSGLTECSKEI